MARDPVAAVTDLDAMLGQLRAAGVAVDDHVEEHEFGRFGWCWDPEGNKVELWEPPAGPSPFRRGVRGDRVSRPRPVSDGPRRETAAPAASRRVPRRAA